MLHLCMSIRCRSRRSFNHRTDPFSLQLVMQLHNHFDFLVRYQGSHQNSLDVPGAFERDAGFQQLLEVGRYLSIVMAVQPSWENAMEDVWGLLLVIGISCATANIIFRSILWHVQCRG